MTPSELGAHVVAACQRLSEAADELRQLDAAIGDGDLGVTVTSASAAVVDAVSEADAETPISDLLATIADAVRHANPSTFGTLIGSGLARAARDRAVTELGPPEAVAIGRTVFETVARRGRSKLGDKTVLDALGPSLDALERAAGDGASAAEALEAAIGAARDAVETSAQWVSAKGRAGWMGERTAGQPDPGSVAYLRFLEAWQHAARRGTANQ